MLNSVTQSLKHPFPWFNTARLPGITSLHLSSCVKQKTTVILSCEDVAGIARGVMDMAWSTGNDY